MHTICVDVCGMSVCKDECYQCRFTKSGIHMIDLTFLVCGVAGANRPSLV